MHSITSFTDAAIPPEQLNAIVVDYLALERARVFRRLCVARFGLLTAVMAVVSLLWLSRFAFWFGITLFLVPPAWTWTVELQRARRLARRLEAAPGVRKS